jgi:hypothetical protein
MYLWSRTWSPPFFLLRYRRADHRGRGSWVRPLGELGLLGNNAMEGREEEAHFYQDMGSFWHGPMPTEMEICFLHLPNLSLHGGLCLLAHLMLLLP